MARYPSGAYQRAGGNIPWPRLLLMHRSESSRPACNGRCWLAVSGRYTLAGYTTDDYYAEDDYAELITGSSAVGFLSKAALSADAISQLIP
jgi:hypothetical protein